MIRFRLPIPRPHLPRIRVRLGPVSFSRRGTSLSLPGPFYLTSGRRRKRRTASRRNRINRRYSR